MRDTIDNHVVYRNNNTIKVYKVGYYQDKGQLISSFNYQEMSNKDAMAQCCRYYSQERLEKITKDSVVHHLKDEAIGRVFLYLVLSKTMNIEYFELSGHGINSLTSEDVLNLYKAISTSQLFSLWSVSVPYVVFGVAFFIN